MEQFSKKREDFLKEIRAGLWNYQNLRFKITLVFFFFWKNAENEKRCVQILNEIDLNNKRIEKLDKFVEEAKKKLKLFEDEKKEDIKKVE